MCIRDSSHSLSPSKLYTNVWGPNSGNKVSIGSKLVPYRHYMCFFSQHLRTFLVCVALIMPASDDGFQKELQDFLERKELEDFQKELEDFLKNYEEEKEKKKSHHKHSTHKRTHTKRRRRNNNRKRKKRERERERAQVKSQDPDPSDVGLVVLLMTPMRQKLH